MSDSEILSSTLPNRNTLWNHCIGNTLASDIDSIKESQIGGLKRMNHFVQYSTNIEHFDNRFSQNSPTIVNIRYFIMHCHVNDYKNNDIKLMLQDEETFGGINVINLESKYWKSIKLQRATAESVPNNILSSLAPLISTHLPLNNFKATTAAAALNKTTTGGTTTPLTPQSTNLFSKKLISLTHDPYLITPDLVDVSGLIKYTRIKLRTEEDILIKKK